MQLSLAIAVLFACVAISVQQTGTGPPAGRPPGRDGQGPPPTGEAKSGEYPRWSARGTGRPPIGKDDDDKRDGEKKWDDKDEYKRDGERKWDDKDEYKRDGERKWDEDEKKEYMQRYGGLMDKLRGGSMQGPGGMPKPPPPPPAGLHMSFQFDMGAALMGAMARPGGDMPQRRDDRDMEPKRDDKWSDKWSDDKSGKGDKMGGMGGHMGGKDGSMGGKDGRMGDKDGGMGSKMGDKDSKDGKMGWKKDDDEKRPMRPHRPIICKVNASGTIVKRDCPFNLTCGGGMGIKQGDWTMFFCRKDMPMKQASEFDYPDQGEFYMPNDEKMGDEKKDDMDGKDGDATDDMDVIDDAPN